MEKDYYNYDVIVIGGGLSGCTAASTSAGTGAKTLLITINMDSPASMQFGNIFHKEKITGILACMDKQGSRRCSQRGCSDICQQYNADDS